MSASPRKIPTGMSRDGPLQLFGERARVLDADEREDGKPEQRREQAPGEVDVGQRATDRIGVPGPSEADDADDEQRAGDREGEEHLDRGERPNAEQVDHGDEGHVDDGPELVVARRAEDVRRDQGGDEVLGGPREELDGDVADADRDRGEEGPETRADVLVHRAGLRDHRRELREAHGREDHRDEADREGDQPHPAGKEPARHGGEHARSDDEAERRADRSRQPDDSPFEADLRCLCRLPSSGHVPSLVCASGGFVFRMRSPV